MTEKELVIKSSNEIEDETNNNKADIIKIDKTNNDETDWYLREPSAPCKYYEELRWKCNLFGLYNPCGTVCNENKKCLCIPKITISDIIIFLLFIIWIIVPLIYNINEYSNDDDSNLERLRVIALSFGLGSVRNYLLALLFTQRNTIIRLIFGLPFERAIAYHEMIWHDLVLCLLGHILFYS